MGTSLCVDVLHSPLLHQQHIRKVMNPKDIISMTEDAFYLPRGSLMTWNRKRTIANARAMAMWLCRKNTYFSWIEIGDIFNRDHSSVIHNYIKIDRTECEQLIWIKNHLQGACHERVLQKQNGGSEDLRPMA